MKVIFGFCVVHRCLTSSHLQKWPTSYTLATRCSIPWRREWQQERHCCVWRRWSKWVSLDIYLSTTLKSLKLCTTRPPEVMLCNSSSGYKSCNHYKQSIITTKICLSDLIQHGRAAGMPLYVRCPICNKEFKQKTTLLQHGCIHIESRPYPCPECGKRFRQQSHLTQHLRIHTNEKPFGCLYCPRFFRQRTILNQVSIEFSYSIWN